MSYYVTTPIYYVNAAPHLGPRVLDDRRRRARAPHAPARRRRVLPHGHRRARRARRLAAEREGLTPQDSLFIELLEKFGPDAKLIQQQPLFEDQKATALVASGGK